MPEVLESVRIVDALDILVVAYLIYRVLLILRGTRAIRVLVGLLVLVVLYAASVLLELNALNWILESVGIYLVLAVIVLFQEDIRRGLARVANPLVGTGSKRDSMPVYVAIAHACFRLADQGRGALIAVEREASLEDVGVQGALLEALVSEHLLVSIFQDTTPIHDGAVLVRRDRAWVAGCFLPLTTRLDLDLRLGTRHRAALGLTEQTDSMVFVVSEERRQVTLVFRGELYPVDSPDQLRLKVQELVSLEAAEEKQKDAVSASEGLQEAVSLITGVHAPVSEEDLEEEEAEEVAPAEGGAA